MVAALKVNFVLTDYKFQRERLFSDVVTLPSVKAIFFLSKWPFNTICFVPKEIYLKNHNIFVDFQDLS